jgi:hypothetical protein
MLEVETICESVSVTKLFTGFSYIHTYIHSMDP